MRRLLSTLFLVLSLPLAAACQPPTPLAAEPAPIEGADVTAYEVVGTKVVWFDRAGLHLAALDGSGARLLGASPIQRRALGASGGEAVFGCAAGSGSTCAPWVVDTATGAVSELGPLPAGGPWVLAAGQVYAGESGSGGMVLAESLDGTGGTRAIEITGGARIGALAASPDGRELAAASLETDGSYHVVRFAADGSSIADLGALEPGSVLDPAPLLAFPAGPDAPAPLVVVLGGHDVFAVDPAAGTLVRAARASGEIVSMATTAQGTLVWAARDPSAGDVTIETLSRAGVRFVDAMNDLSGSLIASGDTLLYVEPDAAGDSLWSADAATAATRPLVQAAPGQRLTGLSADAADAYVLVVPAAAGVPTRIAQVALP